MLGREWPGAVLLDRDDAHAGKRQAHTGFLSISCLAMMMRCISLVPSPMTSKRRIAIQALDVEFLRIAVGAVNAHGFDAVLQRRFGGEVFRHARLPCRSARRGRRLRAAASVSRRAGFDARRHFAELELDRLVLADRLAEGLALLRIATGFFERRLRDADAARRDVDAPEFESAQDLLQAPPLDAADQCDRRAR